MTQFRQVLTQHIGQSASDGAGVRLTRVIGGAGIERFDPFLMLDEFGSDNPDDYIAGFPPHPHRGFETITYMLEGRMRHEDHLGNVGLLESGGVQWMTAARGIIHSEMPEQQEGVMRGFQLWLNLPAKDKLGDAKTTVLDSTEGLQVDQIKDLKPDLILGTNAGLSKADYTALSKIAPTIANSGVNPVTGKAVFKPELTPKIASMMATVGFYEHTGDWLFNTGLPAKTGVGGGIMGVVPGVMGVAAFAPPLDDAGNSVKAQAALSDIVGRLNLNIFHPRKSILAEQA